LALPLLLLSSVKAAAATATDINFTGPNGTAVQVNGTGFAPSDTIANFTVTVDGLASKTTLSGSGLAASKQLATSSAGALSGWFIIGGVGSLNLAAGTHSVQISDAVAAPAAFTFTITTPTVTLTPSTGPAGTSVLVSATGFPVSVTNVYTITNTVTTATFAGTSPAITVASGATTGTATTLSSNVISATGGYTGTVSLPAITTGSTFTLTDNLGNTATTPFTLNTPTVTLSPTSGPVGTLVTATVTGFGPGATVATVKIGSGATPTTISPLIPATPTVTEQGTTAFQFAVTTATLTANFVAGAQAITVTDSLNNVATATFTITPKAPVTLGLGAVDTGASYAPIGSVSLANIHIAATGFKASSPVTITGSPGVPSEWLVLNTAAVGTINSGVGTTSAGGALTAYSNPDTLTDAPGTGTYSVTISDGTNSVTVILTILPSGNIITATPTIDAAGSTVTVTYYGTEPTAVLFDSANVATPAAAAQAWPTITTNTVTFTVPGSGAANTISATGATFNTISYTTLSPAISVVSPASPAVGTTVTIAGSGYAASSGTPIVAVDGISVSATGSVGSTGALLATFVVSNFLPGTHTLSVSDSVSYNTASTSFSTSVSSIAVSPAFGAIGAAAKTISITGSGFPAGQSIAVKFDGSATPIGPVTAGLTVTNTNGGIIIYTTSILTTLTVAGVHTITVTAGVASATATFTVNPTINTGGVTAVKPGTVVTIGGAGFAATSALSLSLNGTATNWFNTVTTLNTTTVTSDGSGNVPASEAVIITSATVPQTLSITVTDASGNTVSTTLTILGTPSITLAAAQGISGFGTVGIAGTGFTPGSGRVASVNFLSGTTVLYSSIQTAASITVSSTGTFANTVEGFTVPSAAAGTYTVTLTLTVPTESATSATFTILGSPTVTPKVASAAVGTNVTLTVVGLTGITTATLGGTLANLISLSDINVPSPWTTTGANAYSVTTWFIVPSMPAGQYTLLLSDGTRSTTTLFTVTSSITLTPTTGIVKGSTVTIAGTGFATAGTAFTVTVNGVAITAAAGTTGTGGTVATSFTVPLTATASSTVVVTDASGNTATATLAITAPTIILAPTSGVAGSTVQILGSGFQNGQIVIEVGGTIVTTSPASVMVSSGSFIAYVTIPTGLSGNTTVTATDSSNNVGTATFTVTSGATFSVSTTTLSSTAQTLNSAGVAATSFAPGSSVQFSFVLETTTGSGSVVWRITLQQGTSVYNIATTTASISTSPTTLTYTQLIPAGVAAGTWTATVQIFASDGVTPLGVTTLIFTVT